MADTADPGADTGADPLPSSGRVLHVATEVYGTGGHTQMIANWIAGDADHEHHLCLTQQRGRRLPDKLVRAMGEAGTVTALDDADDRLVGRSLALRDLAGSADTVVLHIHPHDVVPGIAFAPARRPAARVLLVNHADHVFWVGTTTPDLVVNLRRSGAELSRTRRGVPADRMDTLIRPLTLRPRVHSREEARASLGVPEGHRLLVTAASGSKYEPVGGSGFLDLVVPVLRDLPGATLLAAGPSAEGAWAELEAEGLGRAMGLLPDIRLLLEAADLYLDSYPFSSLTSMLEAAGLGVPVVTVRPPSTEPGVLGADTPELEGSLVVAQSAEEYRDSLRRLLDDDAGRRRLGTRTRVDVERAHAGGAWPDAVRRVIDGARPRSERGVEADDVRRTGPLDRRVALVQSQAGWGRGVTGARSLNLALFPLRDRLALLARLLASGQWPRPAQLLSAAGARRLRRLRSAWIRAQRWPASSGTARCSDHAAGER